MAIRQGEAMRRSTDFEMVELDEEPLEDDYDDYEDSEDTEGSWVAWETCEEQEMLRREEEGEDGGLDEPQISLNLRVEFYIREPLGFHLARSSPTQAGDHILLGYDVC